MIRSTKYIVVAIYPSKSFRMLSHSASIGFRQTGFPARLYQYAALS
jgi:hypothetical protein